jgi:hypothetical protein
LQSPGLTGLFFRPVEQGNRGRIPEAAFSGDFTSNPIPFVGLFEENSCADS